MKPIALVAALVLAGCYSSSLTGDAHTDPVVDTVTDTSVDTAADTAPDAAVDVVHDAGPDTACTPAGPVTAGFEISGFPAEGEINVELVCDVGDWWEDEGGWGILLVCRSDEGDVEEHELTLDGEPFLMFPYPPEEDLLLRYARTYTWPLSEWFALSAGGGWLVAAGAEAWTHAPEGSEGWYDPLGIGVVAGICPVEPTDCGPHERLALDVEMAGGVHGIVLDGTRGTAGSLHGPTAFVNVESAWRYLDLRCDGPPSTWYDFALVVPPSM